MILSTLRDQFRSFCCQGWWNHQVQKLFWWNEAVEVIEDTEVVEAAKDPDTKDITQSKKKKIEAKEAFEASDVIMSD